MEAEPKHGAREGTVAQNDDVKKLQRSLYDLVKRLDEVNSGRAYSAADIIVREDKFILRARLRDVCLKLFRASFSLSSTSPSTSLAVTAIDTFWRKGVYEALVMSRTALASGADSWTAVDKAYIEGHLAAAVGFLQNVMMIAEDLSGDTVSAFDFSESCFRKYGNIEQQRELSRTKRGGARNEARRRLLNDVTFRCLSHLGDVNRYMSEMSLYGEEEKAASKVRARHFYMQATGADSSNGSPFNQLAAMAAPDSLLDSVYYYLRSLTSAIPFEGAEVNLKKLLEKNAKKPSVSAYEDTFKERALTVLESSAELERCNIFFVQMIKSLLYDDDGAKAISTQCEKALLSIQHCLYLPKDAEDNSAGEGFLPPEMASKMALVLFLVMDRLRKRESRQSMVQAFVIAFFSHMITKLLGDLHLALFGPEMLMNLFELPKVKAEQDIAAELNGPANEEINNGTKAKKNKLDRLRRRRKRANSGDSSSSLDEGNETSEAEDFDDSSESEEEEESELLASESEESDEEDVVVESSRDVLSAKAMVDLLQRQGLNATIRICALWLMNNTAVVKNAGPSSEVLWDRLAKLFTTISLQHPAFEESEDQKEFIEAVEKCRADVGGVEFPEDRELGGLSLRGFEAPPRVIKAAPANSETYKGIHRLLFYYELRDFLCGIPETRLAVDARGDVKVTDPPPISPEALPKAESHKTEGKKNGVIHLNNSSAKDSNKYTPVLSEEKEKLMQNMAKLWLQQEVKDLEGRTSWHRGGLGFAQYSPYIVVDHLALSKHLDLVRELVDCKRFAVIIPEAVIHELDSLKKTEGGARNAIRWLEKQFQGGNRWLRPQRKNETRTLELVSYPKKKDRTTWSLFKILECCNFFVNARGAGEKVGVTLVTASEGLDPSGNGNDAASDSTAPCSPYGLAALFDIRVENVDKFVREKKSSAAPRRQPSKKKEFDASNG